jgi:hypothetical protein
MMLGAYAPHQPRCQHRGTRLWRTTVALRPPTGASAQRSVNPGRLRGCFPPTRRQLSCLIRHSDGSKCLSPTGDSPLPKAVQVLFLGTLPLHPFWLGHMGLSFAVRGLDRVGALPPQNIG